MANNRNLRGTQRPINEGVLDAPRSIIYSPDGSKVDSLILDESFTIEDGVLSVDGAGGGALNASDVVYDNDHPENTELGYFTSPTTVEMVIDTLQMTQSATDTLFSQIDTRITDLEEAEGGGGGGGSSASGYVAAIFEDGPTFVLGNDELSGIPLTSASDFSDLVALDAEFSLDPGNDRIVFNNAGVYAISLRFSVNSGVITYVNADVNSGNKLPYKVNVTDMNDPTAPIIMLMQAGGNVNLSVKAGPAGANFDSITVDIIRIS